MSHDALSPMAHAEYGASSMDRWTSCLGSPRLCAGLPSFDNEWSVDGKVAHAVMEYCLLKAYRSTVSVETVGIDGAEHVVTDEQQRNVQVILDYVYTILDTYPDGQLAVEHRVHIPSQAVPDKMWGTADVRIYVPSIRWLFVFDYKHGVGISKSPDCKQLKFYGLGALWECMNADQAVAGITLAIVQPRSFLADNGGIRDAHFTPADLFKFHAYAEDRAYATLAPDAPLVPDPDNCRWCAAAGAGRCPMVERTAVAVVGNGVTAIRDINKASLPDVAKLSFDQMNYILDARKLLIAFMKSVYETAVGYARAGNFFPGRKLVFTAPRREWDTTTHKEVAIAASLMAYTGRSLEDVFPRQLIGITEAENAMVDAFRFTSQQPGETKKAFAVRQNKASELARETMALLTLKKPGGGVELVPVSDPRPAIDGAQAYFAGINMEGLK